MVWLFRSSSSRALSGVTTAGLAEHELDHLNACLECLGEVYPEHSVDVLRRQLLTAAPESRLEAVADLLAELSTEAQSRPYSHTIERWQRFRSNAYRTAVWKQLRLEFRKLSESTVSSVLLEHNYDYLRCRECLSRISARSWRVSLLSLFSRSSPASIHEGGPSETVTLSAELNTEIARLRGLDKHRLDEDLQLARNLNEQLSREADALFECQCCFGDYAWEDICYCSESHYFCRTCLQHTLEESIHGQGTGVDYLRASVKCIASMVDPPCQATIPPSVLHHVLPEDVLQAFEKCCAVAALESTSMSCIRCPFCHYAVIDNVPAYRVNLRRRLAKTHVFACGLFAVSETLRLSVSAMSACAALWFLFWAGLSVLVLPPDVQTELDRCVRGRNRPAWATIFRCENPGCRRSSCLKCGREWTGIHDCSVERFSDKRTYVARRVDDAVKRTCPRCQLSFVKSGGCNKMSCKCGYKMCYLCRADICADTYDHFCRHFRPAGGPCTECTQCSLFQAEDEDEVIRLAKAEAEREWRERQGGTVRVQRRNDVVPGSSLTGWKRVVFEFYMLIAD